MKLFPLEIHKTTYKENLNQIAELLQRHMNHYEDIKKNNQGSMRGNGICSYVQKRDLHHDEEFIPVVNFILEQTSIYWKKIGYAEKYKPIIKEMWFNVYKEQSYIDIHNHAPIVTTCSFYIQKDSNDGNIVFENPLATLLKHQPYYISKENYHTLFEQEIDTKSGDLILFPGWLNHKTLPNTSKKDRIMIGANICTGV